MDEAIHPCVIIEIFQRIPLVELKWIVRLRLDIYADHFKSSSVIAHRSTTSTAEQVKQSQFHHSTSSRCYPCGCSRLRSSRWLICPLAANIAIIANPK